MMEHNNILKTVDLSIGYPQKEGIAVYDNINISARNGEIVAALGQNGIGKSTLLRTISRLQQSLVGKIYLKNSDIDRFGKLELAKLLSFVSTEIIHVSNMTLFELIALGRFPHTNWMGRLSKKDKLLVHEAIQLVGLEHLANKNINEVSDGERQRAMIARTLAQDTEIIVLDEPTAFLDLPNKYEIIHLLSELSRNKGKTIILSTHDLSIALQEADKIWLMLPDGIVTGSPEDLIMLQAFKPVFEKSKILFDEEKGEIRIKKKTEKNIYLEGKGLPAEWTRRALHRMGYSISEKKETDEWIKIETIDRKTVWHLIKNEEIYDLYSIYDLSLRLRNMN